jgi:hypothetical protein
MRAQLGGSRAPIPRLAATTAKSMTLAQTDQAMPSEVRRATASSRAR